MIERWRPFNSWEPFDSLLDIQREINKLFDESKSTKGSKGELARVDWTPSVDVHEDKEAYYITADLPGITQKDVEVKLEDDVLTIKGERKFENEDKKDNYHRIERFYGTFQRSFSLPKGTESDKIKANFKNGELKLVVPKSEQTKPKQISISVTEK